MRDYRKMYAVLCGAIDDVLDELSDVPQVYDHLRQALEQAEELYINTAEEA